ncbi:MAG TPA: ATP-dependent endonuclease [Morganella sp. (in: Bacteria)]|nr:ATP-dependent endonuclease [Morganella sp. (in: enterobacteria)]
MHISKLSLRNYRNFANTNLLFNKGTNTIIGENGAGKTNIFRAIRLLLDDNMIRSAYRLDNADFHRGLGRWQGHWIIISLEFEEISADEAIQALFLHGTGLAEKENVGKATYNLIFRPNKEIRQRLSQLAKGDHAGLDAILDSVTIDDYETVFTGRSEADFNSDTFYRQVVGDFENVRFNKETEFRCIGAKIPSVLSVSKEISFTFVQALRDVVAEFHNNRTNPLLTLLKGKSGDIDSELFLSITNQVKGLNDSIEALPDVQNVRTDIRSTIKDAAGEAYSPSSLSIKSALPDEAGELFQSLKLFVGESGEGHEGPIQDLSLGGANLIFLTLKLLEFKYRKARQSIANFLLIEEPEAHIHTHIQKTLFDRLNYDDTQIIFSTHSTHISEISNVQNVNILGRDGEKCEAYQPASGLSPEEIGNIQRYLDAVRSNLLFAKSVILVEGDAEEILIPILVKKVLGISLDELGISLINIRSTGFQNVAVLFHDDRIRKRCSIVTDLDKSIIDTNTVEGDSEAKTKRKAKYKTSEKKGLARKTKLEAFCNDNDWIAPFFAPHTFEVDFVTAGNARKVISVLPKVYTDEATITKAKLNLNSGDIALYGQRVLTMAENKGKGWFAILLGKKIDPHTAIPRYILDAISFAHPIVKKEVWFNILNYRMNVIEEDDPFVEAEALADFRTKLQLYKNDVIDFVDIKNEMSVCFSDDRINDVLEVF